MESYGQSIDCPYGEHFADSRRFGDIRLHIGAYLVLRGQSLLVKELTREVVRPAAAILEERVGLDHENPPLLIRTESDLDVAEIVVGREAGPLVIALHHERRRNRAPPVDLLAHAGAV